MVCGGVTFGPRYPLIRLQALCARPVTATIANAETSTPIIVASPTTLSIRQPSFRAVKRGSASRVSPR
jgi:hypothetical protein